MFYPGTLFEQSVFYRVAFLAVRLNDTTSFGAHTTNGSVQQWYSIFALRSHYSFVLRSRVLRLVEWNTSAGKGHSTLGSLRTPARLPEVWQPGADVRLDRTPARSIGVRNHNNQVRVFLPVPPARRSARSHSY